MKIAGIITEYNPFHLGHAYQIEETKKQFDADHVIVVMSPNFVQRGEPALYDKFTRTALALEGGADLVLELPTFYATASAENFSYGAVSLLNQLGVVDYLCFGSELGDIDPIRKIASFLSNEPANFKNALKSELKNGYSYPKARDLALKATYHGDTEFLKGSNNILGIEYIKSLEELNSAIKPVTIKRVGASYLSSNISDVLPSATAIRKQVKVLTQTNDYTLSTLNQAIPEQVLALLDAGSYNHPVFMDDIFFTLKYIIESTSIDSLNFKLKNIYDFSDELFNRVKKLMTEHRTYESFIQGATSKNYTKTTIQRALIHLYLNITGEDIHQLKESGHQYIRVLGFKKEAKEVLHHIKKNSSLQLVTNVSDHIKLLDDYGKALLTREITYTNLYHQILQKKYNFTKKNDYRQPIIVR